MRILALDLGSRTGWAVGVNGARLESGVQVFDKRRGESPGLRFLSFRRWLMQITVTAGADLIVYELPHHRGGGATELTVGFATRVMELAADKEVEHASVHTATLKKHATGSGRAGKEAMLMAARTRWGVPSLEDEDEADALCVLAWAIDQYEIRGRADDGEGGREIVRDPYGGTG